MVPRLNEVPWEALRADILPEPRALAICGLSLAPPLRPAPDRLADRREGIATRPAARAKGGLYVTTPQPNLNGTECWRRGWFEAQDEGSQLVGELASDETVLDLCAGAGGKSLLLAARGARVTAHDPHRGRLARLRVRAARAGAEIEISDTPVAADTVLVDAPCSELGILRRGPDSRWLADPGTFAALETLQRDLLETAALLARKRIVYATCTLRREENEDVALELKGSAWRRGDFVRFLPHLHGTDGFFAAVWERR
jgi:16S rRNA (cytosine967-C5)-methyltransferase